MERRGSKVSSHNPLDNLLAIEQELPGGRICFQVLTRYCEGSDSPPARLLHQARKLLLSSFAQNPKAVVAAITSGQHNRDACQGYETCRCVSGQGPMTIQYTLNPGR